MIVYGITDTRISSERLELEPLKVAHAQEMQGLLDDPELHSYTGGEPSSLDELVAQYTLQAVGESPDGTQYWLNWIVRQRESGAAVGYVQATIDKPLPDGTAEIAWVIGRQHQRQGYASEAARTVVQHLRGLGIATVIAHIHRSNASSISTAKAIGLKPTDIVVDGETRWLATLAAEQLPGNGRLDGLTDTPRNAPATSIPTSADRAPREGR